ncbi:MAG: hypothetical protein H0W72_08865, partial [Planctomycetes bacterium]|nr:hypothetical protein [Planctomycetota bacterium]
MANPEIGSTRALPLSVAIEVVTQGLRIRFGRSLVTIAGVVSGIAFLASVLTSALARHGVAQMREAADEAVRMQNLIESESGPLRGRGVAVLAWAAPSAAETHLVDHLRDQGVQIAWYAADPALNPPVGARLASDPPAAAEGAFAVIVVGEPAGVAWPEVLARAARPVVAAVIVPALPTS